MLLDQVCDSALREEDALFDTNYRQFPLLDQPADRMLGQIEEFSCVAHSEELKAAFCMSHATSSMILAVA